MSKSDAPILLVDDTDANRDMLSRRLQRLDSDVILAASGPEALEIIHSRPVALVLLDVEMPGMNGLEVLTTLRQKYSPI